MEQRQITELIRGGTIDFLRYLWVDNGNMIRAKALYLPAFLAYYGEAEDEALLAALEDTVSISAALQALPATQDAPAAQAGLAPVQDVRLVPAWDSFVLTAVPERSASVICEMAVGAEVWAHCPRSFLRRMIAALEAQGLALHIGLELEFYLLHPAGDPQREPQPVDRVNYAHSLATQISQPLISEIIRTLWEQGIPVEQFIAEAGPGQQEITLEHCGPLVLADRLVHARGTIHGTAVRHGLAASFLPVVFEAEAGSGLHTHLSVWREGRNVMAGADQPWGISAVGSAFVAGVLAHLPALMAVTTPTRNSYRRLRPHAWSGAYQAWGMANKEAALRVITDPLSGVPTNVELKTFDGTANPYLALGCLIAAGLDGVARGLRLPEPAEIDPEDYSKEERAQRGIEPLPGAPEVALRHFAQDAVLQEALGMEMAAVFMAVRQEELRSLADFTFAQERALLLQRY